MPGPSLNESVAKTPEHNDDTISFGSGACDEGHCWWTAAGSMVLLRRFAERDKADVGPMMEHVINLAWPMALRRHGCRVVQRALEIADQQDRLCCAGKLRKHVVEAAMSPHANYVLQCCIVLLPSCHLQFIVEEIRGHLSELVRHRFGCRIVERLLEHFPQDAMAELVEEVLDSGIAQLCLHEFGNFVVQHILEYCRAEHRARIVDVLVPQATRLAKHRIGSYVIERALLYCKPDDRKQLTVAMSGGMKSLAKLGRSLYGSFVVRQFNRAEAIEDVQTPASPHLD